MYSTHNAKFKFDLVTAHVVFHHIKDYNVDLAALNRALKPNGLLIIREHDVTNDNTAKYINFVHLVVEFSQHFAEVAGPDLDKFRASIQELYDGIAYLKLDQMRQALQNNGFAVVSIINPLGPQRIYTLMAKKIRNV